MTSLLIILLIIMAPIKAKSSASGKAWVTMKVLNAATKWKVEF
jgi:hypothetical protein